MTVTILARLREIERFLDRRIAAADHRDILAAIEEAIAGGAGRHAKALEGLLGRNAQPFRLRAGRDRSAHRGVDRCRNRPWRGTAATLRSTSVMMSLTISVPTCSACFSISLHQPGTLDRIGEARIVLDIGGDRELAALLQAGDQHRLQHGARGIDRRRVAGRAGTDDEDWRMLGGHGNAFAAAAGSTLRSEQCSRLI